MNSDLSFFSSPIGRSVRLFGLLGLMGLMGYSFVRINQSVRITHLTTSAKPDELKKALAESPNDRELLRTFAYKQFREGDPREAMEAMQRLVKLEPDSISTWFGLARCAAMAGNANVATEAYQKVLSFEPQNATARLAVGEIYAEAGLVTDALREYDAVNDKEAAARFGGPSWAKSLMHEGRNEEAWNILVGSLKQMPMQEKPFLTLAELGIKLKRFGEAEALIQRRIGNSDFYPMPEVRRAMARVLLAQPESPDSLETAEAVMRVLMANDDEDVESNALLGQVLLARGKRQEAKAALERGLKTDPNHRASLTLLAELSTKLGQSEQAARLRARLETLKKQEGDLPALRKAVEVAPDNAAAQLRLTDALDRAGLFGEAADVCEAILAKNPSDAKASEMRDAFRQKALDKLTKSGEFKASVPSTPSEMAP
jgi:tetratricopeptide (TPR) repeat protein